MFCSNCGTENPETSSFCSKCGQPINGTAIPIKKKRNIWIWIGIGFLIIILVCCIAPLTYNYIKLKFAPTTTPTPQPTFTPKPTFTSEPSKTALPLLTSTSSLTGMWVTKFGTSSFDNSKTVVILLNANSPVTGWLNETYLPVLYIRCQEQKIDVYIAVGLQQNVEYGLYNKSTVRVRFDSDTAETFITNHSTDNQALFFKNPTSMMNEILKHQTMVFGFTPFNASPVETSFNLNGVTDAIKPLLEDCK